MRSTLDRYFGITDRGSTVAREVRGAFATFLTMAYILFVNPQILAAAGVPRDSAVACTAAAVCCVLMGGVANFPMALASGMGINAMVASGKIIIGLRRLLIVDSISASIRGVFGASSVTSYFESAAGVAEGARTGLHSVVVGLLFAACVFAAPLVGVVPKEATAPALVLVGFYMIGQFARIDFAKLETAIPAFITLLTIPLTWSISHGIRYGFVAYVVIKVLGLRFGDVHPAMCVSATAFAAYFAWEGM